MCLVCFRATFRYLNDGSVKNFIKRRFVHVLYVSKIPRVQVNDDVTPRRGSLLPATSAPSRRSNAIVYTSKGDCCNSRLPSPMCRDASRVGRLSSLCGQILKLGGKIGIQYPRKGNNSVVLKYKNTKKNRSCTCLQQT